MNNYWTNLLQNIIFYFSQTLMINTNRLTGGRQEQKSEALMESEESATYRTVSYAQDSTIGIQPLVCRGWLQLYRRDRLEEKDFTEGLKVQGIACTLPWRHCKPPYEDSVSMLLSWRRHQGLRVARPTPPSCQDTQHTPSAHRSVLWRGHRTQCTVSHRDLETHSQPPDALALTFSGKSLWAGRGSWGKWLES